jgi:DNA-binding response OmpR family regulator
MNNFGSILLVDDDETFRESTSRLLCRQGFICRSASDGPEAAQVLQGQRFDVMIADVRMPNNPDLWIVRTAKQRDEKMAVILVTGFPSEETAIRSIQLSVLAYLTKPVNFEELLRYVRTAVRHSWNRCTLTAVQERLKNCLAELELAESGQPFQTARNNRLVSAGTIRTLASCLSELLSLDEWPELNGGSRNLCELLDCRHLPVHRRAILEAIEVLKKTKSTFKSKVLAEARTRLEDSLKPMKESCSAE